MSRMYSDYDGSSYRGKATSTSSSQGFASSRMNSDSSWNKSCVSSRTTSTTSACSKSNDNGNWNRPSQPSASSSSNNSRIGSTSHHPSPIKNASSHSSQNPVKAERNSNASAPPRCSSSSQQHGKGRSEKMKTIPEDETIDGYEPFVDEGPRIDTIQVGRKDKNSTTFDIHNALFGDYGGDDDNDKGIDGRKPSTSAQKLIDKRNWVFTTSADKMTELEAEIHDLREKMAKYPPFHKVHEKLRIKLFVEKSIQWIQTRFNFATSEEQKEAYKKWHEKQLDVIFEYFSMAAPAAEFNNENKKNSSNPNNNEERRKPNSNSSEQNNLQPLKASELPPTSQQKHEAFIFKTLEERLETHDNKDIRETDPIPSTIVEMEFGRIISKSSKCGETAYFKLNAIKDDAKIIPQNSINLNQRTKQIYFPFSLDNHYAFYLFNCEHQTIKYFDTLQRNGHPPEEHMAIKENVKKVAHELGYNQIHSCESEHLPHSFQLKAAYDSAVMMLGLLEASLTGIPLTQIRLNSLEKKKEILRNFDELMQNDFAKINQSFLNKQQQISSIGPLSKMVDYLKNAKLIEKNNLTNQHILSYMQLFVEFNHEGKNIAIVNAMDFKKNRNDPRQYAFNFGEKTEIIFFPVKKLNKNSLYFYNILDGKLSDFNCTGKAADPFRDVVIEMVEKLCGMVPSSFEHLEKPESIRHKHVTNKGVAVIDVFERISRYLSPFVDVKYDLKPMEKRVKRILNAVGDSNIPITDIRTYNFETISSNNDQNANSIVSKLVKIIRSPRKLRNGATYSREIVPLFNKCELTTPKSLEMHNIRWGNYHSSQNKRKADANTYSSSVKLQRNETPNGSPMEINRAYDSDMDFIDHFAPNELHPTLTTIPEEIDDSLKIDAELDKRNQIFSFSSPPQSFFQDVAEKIKNYTGVSIAHLVKLTGSSPLRNMPSIQHIFKPKELYDVIGDGNCGFRVLSYLIFGTDIYHWALRKVITKWRKEKENDPKSEEAKNWASIDGKEVRNTGGEINLWLSDLDFVAFTTIFKINVLCYTNRPSQYSQSGFHWECYDAGKFNAGNLYIEETVKKCNPSICIYHKDDHYQAITSIAGKDIPPPDDFEHDATTPPQVATTSVASNPIEHGTFSALAPSASTTLPAASNPIEHGTFPHNSSSASATTDVASTPIEHGTLPSHAQESSPALASPLAVASHPRVNNNNETIDEIEDALIQQTRCQENIGKGQVTSTPLPNAQRLMHHFSPIVNSEITKSVSNEMEGSEVPHQQQSTQQNPADDDSSLPPELLDSEDYDNIRGMENDPELLKAYRKMLKEYWKNKKQKEGGSEMKNSEVLPQDQNQLEMGQPPSAASEVPSQQQSPQQNPADDDSSLPPELLDSEDYDNIRGMENDPELLKAYRKMLKEYWKNKKQKEGGSEMKNSEVLPQDQNQLEMGQPPSAASEVPSQQQSPQQNPADDDSSLPPELLDSEDYDNIWGMENDPELLKAYRKMLKEYWKNKKQKEDDAVSKEDD